MKGCFAQSATGYKPSSPQYGSPLTRRPAKSRPQCPVALGFHLPWCACPPLMLLEKPGLLMWLEGYSPQQSWLALQGRLYDINSFWVWCRAASGHLCCILQECGIFSKLFFFFSFNLRFWAGWCVVFLRRLAAHQLQKLYHFRDL